MMKKICKKCNISYTEFENYCNKCGGELENAPNRCSKLKHGRCYTRELEDSDVYCSYCGALTTYALERERKNNVKEV